MRFFTLLLLLILPARAFINYADSIVTDKRLLLFDTLTNSFIISECCQSSIQSCIVQKPQCSIALRFYHFTAWMIMNNNDLSVCYKQLNKRLLSFTALDTFAIASSPISVVGDSSSPFLITVYTSTDCGICKKVIIPLHTSVTDGPLLKKAQLQIKPMSSHIGNLGLLAAEKQNKGWDLYLSLADVQRRIDERTLRARAKMCGMDVKKFMIDIQQTTMLKKEIFKMRMEATKNGVSVTPTIFINGCRYQSYKNPQWIIDLVNYLHETSVEIR